MVSSLKSEFVLLLFLFFNVQSLIKVFKIAYCEYYDPSMFLE